MKKLLLAVTLIVTSSVFAMGSDVHLTARELAKGAAVPSRSTIRLSTPHACTVSKAHPCVYYGGDLNASDPHADGLANENTLVVPYTYTYNEVAVPVNAKIHGAFTNDMAEGSGVLDPMTGTWDFRTNVSEGNGGTSIGSGDSSAEFTPTGRIIFGVFPEYELLTATPLSLPKGNVWYTVLPNCTNPNDNACGNETFFETTTDGTLNAINGKFTVTSATGMGPTIDSSYYGYTYADWCNDLDFACGEGMSSGLLK